MRKQSVKATLTTITPVHIGCGQTLTRNIDFVVEKGRVGFIDLQRVVALLGEDFIYQLTALIEKNESLWTFIKNQKPGARLEDVCNRIAKAGYVNDKVKQLKVHYRTALQGLCIPGSSLKGSIKTTILRDIISQQGDKFVLPDLSSSAPKAEKRWKDANLQSKVFGDVDKLDKNINGRTTRFLKIGDVQFRQIDSQVLNVRIANQRHNDWQYKHGQELLVEVVPAGVSTTFQIKIDKELYNHNQKKYPHVFEGILDYFITDGYSELCQIINHHTKQLLLKDIKELRNASFDLLSEEYLETCRDIVGQINDLDKEKACIIRVGAGSGWRFMTGSWVEYDYIKAQKHRINYDQLIYDIRRKNYSGDVLFPKTRKLSYEGMPFGFVKITIDS